MSLELFPVVATTGFIYMIIVPYMTSRVLLFILSSMMICRKHFFFSGFSTLILSLTFLYLKYLLVSYKMAATKEVRGKEKVGCKQAKETKEEEENEQKWITTSQFPCNQVKHAKSSLYRDQSGVIK